MLEVFSNPMSTVIKQKVHQCVAVHKPLRNAVFELQNEILKEERAALRSSLRGTSCTTSQAPRYTPTTTALVSPKSSRVHMSGSSTAKFSNGTNSSWRHVDPPSKSTGVRSLGSSSPTN